MSKPTEWATVAETQVEGETVRDYPHHALRLRVQQRGEHWQVIAQQVWDRVQEQGRVEGGQRACRGRGATPEEAMDAIRRDVIAWAMGTEPRRSIWAAAMRDVLYTAQDAIEAVVE